MKSILCSLCLFIASANAEMIKIDQKEVVIDTHNRLMWHDSSDVAIVKKDWQGAMDYCENFIFSGYSDWRLPGIHELLSIRDETSRDIAINNHFLHTVNSKYWSSSSIYNSSYSWTIDFKNGDDNADLKNFNYYVRCVRDN